MKKTLDLLGIDLGASSGRGIVGSYDGEKLSLREVHRFPNEPQMVAGRFTWDILRLYAESKNAIRAAAGGELRSIGIDGASITDCWTRTDGSSAIPFITATAAPRGS